MNHVLMLCVDGVDFLDCASVLYRGDASTSWCFVHNNFYAHPTLADVRRFSSIRGTLSSQDEGRAVRCIPNPCMGPSGTIPTISSTLLGKLPNISNDEALRRIIQESKPLVRMEFERALGKSTYQGWTLDVMESIGLAETEDKLLSRAIDRFTRGLKLYKTTSTPLRKKRTRKEL